MDILLLLGIVFLTHFIGALTGFGATVLALPMTISIIGIQTAKPMLTILGFLQCLLVAIKQFRNIDFSQVKKVVSIVIIGMIFGILLYNMLDQNLLIFILSIFMIVISIKGFLELFGFTFKNISNPILNIILFIGGIIHGAFVSGGPLLMIYSSEKMKAKETFRATMSMIWVVLNGILIIEGILSNTYTTEIIGYTLLTLPVLFLSVFVANKLSSKVNQKIFSFIIYTTLLINAILNLS